MKTSIFPNGSEELHSKMRYTPFGEESEIHRIKEICRKSKFVSNYSPWPIECWQLYRQDLLCSRNRIRHSEFPPPQKNDVKAIWNRALLHLYPHVCFLHNIMLTPKACFIRLAKKSIYFTRFILRHPTCMDVSFHKKTLALECLKTFQTM